MRISQGWVGCVRVGTLALLTLMGTPRVFGWGRDGHRMINRLAAQSLPADVPAFLRNGQAADTLEYLGPEPDRWRNRAEDELSYESAPDHFIDLEYADLLGTLPKRRQDFVKALAVAQKSHPDLPLNPGKVGMQPWEVEEIYERLKVAMREYRKLLVAGDDTRPDEMAILFYAGWLGHYVADGSQPLHTTYQYNGWTGANPKGYSAEHTIHSQFESAYVTANVKAGDVRPLVMASAPALLADEWTDYLSYLHTTESSVERVYQIDKPGGFSGSGTPEAKTFTVGLLANGAIELRNLIYTAWVRSGDPVQEYRGPQ